MAMKKVNNKFNKNRSNTNDKDNRNKYNNDNNKHNRINTRDNNKFNKNKYNNDNNYNRTNNNDNNKYNRINTKDNNKYNRTNNRTNTKNDNNKNNNNKNISSTNNLLNRENKESIIEKSFNDKIDHSKVEVKDIRYEMDTLYNIIMDKEYNLSLSIYFIDVLSLNMNSKHVTDFINLLFKIISCKRASKYLIYNLRIIHCILRLKYFIPLTVELLVILKNSIKLKSNITGKKISYENIKIDSDRVDSLEYRNFVISESLKLLFSHINSFSNTLAFPELSKIVMEELKNVRIKEFDEVVKEIIGMVDKHSKYVIEEREKKVKECSLLKISERNKK
ncbi:hypothetical protein SLOPH_1649 [Spraguea lophii 42_110]|uniref:Uncharacterized protein n=1 Tax=Spraguea lophii (strain 42_110) TaxID=1358809 RepID=S7W9R2_SPRLO|nr:hypothetical protein SLOPH_1649 [Spraguea lophii 42_110]